MQQVEIYIKGHLDKKWAEWLGDLEMTHTEAQETILTGILSDQAALFGLMTKLRELGVKIIALRFAEHLPQRNS